MEKNKVKHVCYLISKTIEVFLGEWGHCPSFCPDLCTLKKLNSPRKAWWRIYHLNIPRIKDYQSGDTSSGQNECAMCWRYQECHPACAQEWWNPFVKIILLKAGSVSKLLCIWLRFSSRAGAELSGCPGLALPVMHHSTAQPGTAQPPSVRMLQTTTLFPVLTRGIWQGLGEG